MVITNHRCIAVLLSAVLATLSFPAPVQARASTDCAPEINRLRSETSEFGRDVEEQVRAFTQTEVADASLNAMGTLLKNTPTAAALSDLRDQKKKWDDWGELTKATATTLEDLSKCISTPGCSLIEFAGRQKEAFRLWIQSLASDGLSAASERVSKAASLYRGYVNRSLSMAQNGMLGAVNSCTADFEQKAPNDPVDAGERSNPQARSATTVKSGGGGGATAVKLGVAAGAIGVGGVMLKKQLDNIMADSAGTTTSSSGSSSSSNSNWIYANWTCNNSSQCITVRGHAMGSAGPFCSVSACTAWNAARGTGTCTAQPQYPTMIWNFPPAGTCSN